MRLDAYGAAGGNDKNECYVSAPPSENIWDKFELDSDAVAPHKIELDSNPITPPRSPDLSLMFGVDDYELDAYLSSLSRRSIDGEYSRGLRSKVIHDCMWSGDSNNTGSATARPSLTTSSGNGDGIYRSCPGERQRKESFGMAVASVAAVTGASTTTAVPAATTAVVDCVDPAAVFPYPLNREHSYSMMTPAPSDSEDEIDVVGGAHLVDSQRVRTSTSVCRLPQPTAGSVTSASSGGYQQQPPPVRQLSQSLKVVAATRSEYGSTFVVDMNHNRLSAAAAANERLLSNSVSQKRTALRVSGSIAGQQQQQAQRFHHHPYHNSKRTRRHLTTPTSVAPSLAPVLLLQQHSPPSSGGSRNSSDSEDYDGKRSMHNVLERKRRNDLKSSFFLLRDHVPELRQHERAAKVVILAKATEYTRRLRQEEACLLAELSAEKQKQARLLDQLERLRTSCATGYHV